MFQRLGREVCPDIRNTQCEFPQGTKAKDPARLHLESSQLTRERIEPKVSCCRISFPYIIMFLSISYCFDIDHIVNESSASQKNRITHRTARGPFQSGCM